MATPFSNSIAQFRIEDVARKPRGYHVRTVTGGAHRVRVAFPPGPRKRGSGKLVQILHPKAENPKRCANASVEAWLDQAQRARDRGDLEKAYALEKIALEKEKKEEAKSGCPRPRRRRNKPRQLLGKVKKWSPNPFYSTKDAAIRAAKQLAKRDGYALYVYPYKDT